MDGGNYNSTVMVYACAACLEVIDASLFLCN